MVVLWVLLEELETKVVVLVVAVVVVVEWAVWIVFVWKWVFWPALAVASE